MVNRVMLLSLCVFCAGPIFGRTAVGQGSQPQLSRPPVIDMHNHASLLTPRARASMDSLNIRYLFVSSTSSEVQALATADTNRFLVAMVFPCDKGQGPIVGGSCFDFPTDFPDTLWLRAELKARRIRGFGEVEPAYLGLSPNDPRMEPYWRLAEEFDIPVGIHMGPGPAGVAYESAPVKIKSPLYRTAMTDPILLEDVLLRHKKLRLFMMHAGWPRIESTIVLLHAHPNVYVDVAALEVPTIVPRIVYYKYLNALVEAGFAKRIMFGSDFAPQQANGIDAILKAEFLNAEQKSDILCSNAMRFLRLRKEVCQP